MRTIKNVGLGLLPIASVFFVTVIASSSLLLVSPNAVVVDAYCTKTTTTTRHGVVTSIGRRRNRISRIGGGGGRQRVSAGTVALVSSPHQDVSSLSSLSRTTTTVRTFFQSTRRRLLPQQRRNRTGRTPDTTATTKLFAASTTSAAALEDDDGSAGKKDNYNWTKQNLQIAIPALIGMLADPLLSLMDTAYVGHLGTRELAALGACTSIFHLAFNAFRATTQATTSLVATALQRNQQEAQQVTSISLKLGLFIGLCVMIGLQVGGTWCLGTMGIPFQSTLFQPASQYLSTRAWAAPVVLGIVVAEGAFRGYGDTKIPLLASLAASIVNLVLDPILMFPLGLGVMGAAAATALSQVAAGAVYATFLRRRNMLGGGGSTDTDNTTEEDAPLITTTTTTKLPQNTTTLITNDESVQPMEVEITKEDLGASSSPSLAENQEEEEGETTTATTERQHVVRQGKVIWAILSANLAMMTKQGSLLLGWAYATSRATRIGANHVAAHQVALSCWLVLALMLDGAAVSAQVLMSRAYAQKQIDKRKAQVKSLISYFTRFAILQGATACLVWLTFLGRYVVPHVFTSDPTIRTHLISLMPTLAWQQILVSTTLVVEALAVGGHQFQIMALGTTISTVLAMNELQHATNIVSIWARGINTLFIGRLLTATIATFRVARLASKKQEGDKEEYEEEARAAA